MVDAVSTFVYHLPPMGLPLAAPAALRSGVVVPSLIRLAACVAACVWLTWPLADRLPDAGALDALVRETGLTQIVIHAGASPAWGDLAAAGGDARLRLAARGPEWLLFDVRPAPL